MSNLKFSDINYVHTNAHVALASDRVHYYNIYYTFGPSCTPVCVMQLFCHPKYSILYGALMIFVVGSGQELSSSPATTVTWLMLLVVSCSLLLDNG